MCCPKCGAMLETYVKYCAGQPIVAYFCSYCHYNSANVDIIYSNKSVDQMTNPDVWVGTRYCPNCGARMDGGD